MSSKTCDIVVIGGGGSGLVAAARAAMLGRSVIVLEKDRKTLGGLMNMASTMRTFGSRWQSERGLPDTTILYLRNRMDETFWRIDRKLATNVIRGTGWFFDWFEEIAPEKASDFDVGRYVFDDPADGPLGPQSGGHGFDPNAKKGSGKIFMETAQDKLRELGQEILMDAAAEKILVENGRVTGVRATVSGKPMEIACRAVIIASGGWMANPEIVRTYFPALADALPFMDPCPHTSRNYTGDGLRLAEDAGALMDETNRTIRMMGPMTMCRSQVMSDMGFSHYSILVNAAGKRYVCEGSQQRMGSFDSGMVQLEQPAGRVFLIFDAGTLEKTVLEAGGKSPMPIPGMGGPYPSNLKEAQAEMAPVLEKNDGTAFSADSVAELAEKLGIDPAALTDTVSRYNACCEEGMDWDCYKPSDWLVPLNTAPYYAVKASISTDGAFGGILVDENMRVRAAAGGIVDGLYASGDICSGRFINMTGVKKQILNDMSFALSSGFLAGTDAARYTA